MQETHHEDPVERLKRFKELHPEIVIIPPNSGSYFWSAEDEGEQVASGYWLRQLMEMLEARYT